MGRVFPDCSRARPNTIDFAAMTVEIALMLLLVGLGLVAFARQAFPMEVTALGMMAVVYLLRFVDTKEVFSGFSNKLDAADQFRAAEPGASGEVVVILPVRCLATLGRRILRISRPTARFPATIALGLPSEWWRSNIRKKRMNPFIVLS